MKGTLKKLCCFLKEIDLYDKYRLYVTNEKYWNYGFVHVRRGKYESLSNFFLNTSPHDYFFNAFAWAATTEGYKFWEIVHLRWRNYIKTNFNHF